MNQGLYSLRKQHKEGSWPTTDRARKNPGINLQELTQTFNTFISVQCWRNASQWFLFICFLKRYEHTKEKPQMQIRVRAIYYL